MARSGVQGNQVDFAVEKKEWKKTFDILLTVCIIKYELTFVSTRKRLQFKGRSIILLVVILVLLASNDQCHSLF